MGHGAVRKALPKRENLSLSPENLWKRNLGAVASTYNATAGDAETRGSWNSLAS